MLFIFKQCFFSSFFSILMSPFIFVFVIFIAVQGTCLILSCQKFILNFHFFTFRFRGDEECQVNTQFLLNTIYIQGYRTINNFEGSRPPNGNYTYRENTLMHKMYESETTSNGNPLLRVMEPEGTACAGRRGTFGSDVQHLKG